MCTEYAGKTVISLENMCRTWAPAHRGVITTRCYTNPRLPLPKLNVDIWLNSQELVAFWDECLVVLCIQLTVGMFSFVLHKSVYSPVYC